MSLEDMLEGVALITRVETGRLESIYVCMGRSVLLVGQEEWVILYEVSFMDRISHHLQTFQ